MRGNPETDTAKQGSRTLSTITYKV